MPDFEPDQDSVSRAEKLSSRLMGDLRSVSEERPPAKMRRELFSERRYSEYAEGVPINDVLGNVNQMAAEFAAARRWNGEIPCMKVGDGELAPISLNEFFGGPMMPSYGSEGLREFWDRNLPFPPHRFWREMVRGSGLDEERIVITDIRDAEGGLNRSLIGFLSYRFAGIKRWADWIRGVGDRGLGGSNWPPRGPSTSQGPSSSPPPPAVGPGGGLQVHVSCITPGLRIHVSPAYFISWVYFGSPTTPVASYLLPGRYIFAGDGPMQPRRKTDPAVFCIPADYYPSLTRF